MLELLTEVLLIASHWSRENKAGPPVLGSCETRGRGEEGGRHWLLRLLDNLSLVLLLLLIYSFFLTQPLGGFLFFSRPSPKAGRELQTELDRIMEG